MHLNPTNRPNVPPNNNEFDLMQEDIESLRMHGSHLDIMEYMKRLEILEYWCRDAVPPYRDAAERLHELIGISKQVLFHDIS